MKNLSRRPAWGVGFSYRYVVHREVMSCAGMFDFLEVPSDDYANPRRRASADPDESMLAEAAERFPIVGHGIRLSIGTAEPVDTDHLEQIAAFVDRAPIAEYSDHMAFTKVGDEMVDGFVAIPFTDLGIAAAAANARRVKNRLGLPFLLENVTYHFAIPEAQMSEPEFLGRVAEKADCGLLIDVTNVFINGQNNNYDAKAFIKALPADRVLHAHFCGVEEAHDGYLFDTHAEPTPKEVWELLDFTLANTDLRTVILERDSKFSPFKHILNELWQAKEIFLKHRPASAPSEFTEPAYNPQPTANGSDEGHSAELYKFQKVLFDVLLSEKLCTAIDKEGESALGHTGLGRDERRVIASIPKKRRDVLSNSIRMQRREKEQERERASA